MTDNDTPEAPVTEAGPFTAAEVAMLKANSTSTTASLVVAREDWHRLIATAEAVARDREALAARVRALRITGTDYATRYGHGFNDAIHLAETTLLAATPSPAPPATLDVRRLARAIDAAWRLPGSDHRVFGPGLAGEGRVLAGLIASEWPDA